MKMVSLFIDLFLMETIQQRCGFRERIGTIPFVATHICTAHIGAPYFSKKGYDQANLRQKSGCLSAASSESFIGFEDG